MHYQKRINKTILELTQGDITHQEVDAVVNAANSSLLGGGGVDGAIHRAGGSKILLECKQIREKQGECPPGKAVITTAGNMKAKYVIHTVGPIWKGGYAHEPETLSQAYRNSLKLAEEYHLQRISFPSISTGAYRYPLEKAAMIAIKTVNNYLKGETSLKTVRFVLFNAQTYDAYKKALEQVT